jgi:RNA polymerase-associated protein CTR9
MLYSFLQGQPQSAIERKRRAWSESEDDEPAQRQAEPSSVVNDLSE